MAAVNLLSTQKLSRSFGGLHAVREIDFSLDEGGIHALIGPNGAGKTTFVNLISGRIRATAGTIRYRGEDITAVPAHQRVRRGIAYTFQITSIYPNLSVYENVAIAALGRGRDAHAKLSDKVMSALAHTGLEGHADQRAGALAYGHQRLVEVAMGLALAPRLLILDEPTQGLADSEIADFCRLVKTIGETATVLIIEHNMAVVMELAAGITVLNQGQILAQGTPAEIRANPEVQAAYLGS